MSGARPDALRVVRLRSSLSSPLDGLHGNWEATLGNLAYRVQPTIEAKSKTFTEVMAPLGTAPTTRLKAWRNWRTVVTWAIQNKALDKILPMEVPTLQALLWEFAHRQQQDPKSATGFWPAGSSKVLPAYNSYNVEGYYLGNIPFFFQVESFKINSRRSSRHLNAGPFSTAFMAGCCSE
jgi:hypothetical protein